MMRAKRECAIWALLGGIASIPAVCVAEPLPTSAEPSQAILVTGERTPRPASEVWTSVSITDASALERQPDIDRLERVLQLTPNVVVGSGGQGPTIRGQDTTGVLRDLAGFLGGSRPRATLIVDGRAASYNELVFGTQPLWDVAQVEVFRSPQTTTQGNNAIAGAIFIETAAPSGQWQAGLRAWAGNFATRSLSGTLTGPIVGDELTMRIAGDVRRGVTSSTMEATAQGIDPNRDDYHLVRLKVAARPRGLPDLEIDASLVVTGSQAPQIEGMREPFVDRKDPTARYGIFRSSLTALTLRPRLRLGSDTRLSATFALGSADVRRFAPAGLGEAANAIEDRSFELVVNHDVNTASLVLGANVTQLRLNQDINLASLGFGTGTFTDEQRSLGLFGEARVEPVPGLTLTAGARLQSDRQKRTGALSAAGGERGIEFVRTFTSFSPKLALAYQLNRETRLGLLIQRAANPGGATLSPSSGLLDTFDAESLWDYEVFVRGRVDSIDLGYSANLFHYDFRDAQRSVVRAIETTSGTFLEQEVGNVSRAWSRGAEITFDWSPVAELSLAAGIGLLDTRITSTPTAVDPLLGKQFQRSPYFTGVVTVTWKPSPRFSLDLGYNRRAGYFSDDANTADLRVGPAQSFNARADWRIGHLRVFCFVRNVFDRFDLSYLFDRGRLATAEDPREFGVGTEVRF